jgi:hypothetical protein
MPHTEELLQLSIVAEAAGRTCTVTVRCGQRSTDYGRLCIDDLPYLINVILAAAPSRSHPPLDSRAPSGSR